MIWLLAWWFAGNVAFLWWWWRFMNFVDPQ